MSRPTSAFTAGFTIAIAAIVMLGIPTPSIAEQAIGTAPTVVNTTDDPATQVAIGQMRAQIAAEGRVPGLRLPAPRHAGASLKFGFDRLEEWLTNSGPWLYAGIFVLAVLEGFILTTFLTNGTIAFIALGGLLVHGYLNPAATISAIYIGTVTGDSLTFLLSGRLRNLPLVARQRQRFDRFIAPLAVSPFRFIVLGHLAPYTKSIGALLAAGVVPARKWLKAELIGAMAGTLMFTGIGAAGAAAWGNAQHSNALTGILGLVILFIIVITWVRAMRPCKLADRCGTHPRPRPRRRFWMCVWFMVYFPIWHPVRWVEAALRKLPSRSKHPDLAAAFPDARAGDIFLVRLHSPAPWGKWAHAAIAIDADWFCHGFDKTITQHRFNSFPIRYTVAHLRVKCDAGTAAAAGAVASQMVGRRVSIFANPADTSTFSCTSLVCHAYKAAGCDLRAGRLDRVTPGDLIDSPLTGVIRTVKTENAFPRIPAREVERAAR